MEKLELKLHQMAFSDMIVLNKVDLVDRETFGRINVWLSSRLRRFRFVEAVNAVVPLDILFSVDRFTTAQPETDVPDHHEHGPLRTFARELLHSRKSSSAKQSIGPCL